MKLSLEEQSIVDQALAIVFSRLQTPQDFDSFYGPKEMARYLQLKFAPLTHEVFTVFYLDAQLRVLDELRCSEGSSTACDCHPAPIIKRALELGAFGVVCTHNHPAGRSAPSPQDIDCTITLRNALNLMEIRLLDHLVVGGQDGSVFSILGGRFIIEERESRPLPSDVAFKLSKFLHQNQPRVITDSFV